MAGVTKSKKAGIAAHGRRRTRTHGVANEEGKKGGSGPHDFQKALGSRNPVSALVRKEGLFGQKNNNQREVKKKGEDANKEMYRKRVQMVSEERVLKYPPR